MESEQILIVDDNTNLCKTMKLVLTHQGYDVSVASDGTEALARAKTDQFSTVFLDIRLPGMDGVEVFRHLKRLLPDARIIMMTAYALHDKVAEALAGGAADVIYKPMDMDRVLEKIEAPPHRGAVAEGR